jgi:hypothetical protein
MKTTMVKTNKSKNQMGEYSSIEVLINQKLDRASKTLKNINLEKLVSKKGNS